MTERTEDAQQQALRAFLLLCALAPEAAGPKSPPDAWQGKLVLVRGLDAEGRAISIAATIAGAACLALDARTDVCRATLRAGACDFVVNSIDEALRILKNEIRKRKPVSVAVAMPEPPALEELVARGVAPEAFLVTTPAAAEPVGTRFAEFGTRIVAAAGSSECILDSGKLIDDYATTDQLSLQEFQFATAQELRDLDHRLAAAVPATDLRHRWATLAPGFFYRDRPYRRVAWLTAAEVARSQ
jgi:urocanate hydratase